MGLVEVSIILRNPEHSEADKREIKALVDTGATLTILPREIALSLKISPKSTEKVMTAGGPMGIDISNAEVEIAGKKEIVRVAISDVIDRVLIGVTTLETLGLAVDPVNGQLRESMYLLY
jgi:aspartyl protease family protein